LGSIVIGVFLDKTHKFKLVMISVSLSSVALMTALLFTLPSKNVPLHCLNLAFLGFSAIPLTPLAFGFTVELTYPTPEAFSNGMMLLPSKVYGSLLAVIASAVAASDPRYSILIFIGNACVCLACSIILKEELRRLKPKEDTCTTSPLN
jgi:MFS family permease